MNPAFDSFSVRRTLQRGITAGYWTLADLDQPSRGWLENKEQASHIASFIHPPFRNLLRDEIPAEAVQPIDPRDFDVAAATRANKGQRNMDLLPQRWPDQPHVPDLSNGRDLSSHQDTRTNGPDHGQTSPMGRPGQHHTHSLGALHQQSLEPGDYLDEPAECDF